MRSWYVAGGLLAVHLILTAVLLSRDRPITYVFTPLVDAVPGKVSAEEGAVLQAEAKHAADARDIQRAYARLGSTFSLDDLLRGVEGLSDLSPEQRARLQAILVAAREDHAEVLRVQQELLALEPQLQAQIARVSAGMGGAGQPPLPPTPGPPMPPGQPPVYSPPPGNVPGPGEPGSPQRSGPAPGEPGGPATGPGSAGPAPTEGARPRGKE